MRGKSVLVVDDDINIQHSIGRRLRQEGIRVLTAGSGSEGLEQLRLHRPDLVLLDIMMPGIDGYETCRRVRENPDHNLTKIILVSGNGSLADRIRGYEVGADDFISKPFDGEELLAKVRIHSRLKREEEINRIKSDLLGLISHETRTPLTVIIGAASMIGEEPDLPAPAELVDMIIENGERLQEFIQKTILLCDLKAGAPRPRRKGNLLAHVCAARDALADDAAAADVRVDLEIDEALGCDADWELLERVFRYLLHNAIKHSPAGAAVTVTAALENDLCRIRVIDRGEGIPPDWIGKIFDEFAIRDIMHHHRGQGLSLSIARHVMAAHGGEIDVTSRPGEGATFEIRLPLPARETIPR